MPAQLPVLLHFFGVSSAQNFLASSFHLSQFSAYSSDTPRSLIGSVVSSFQIRRGLSLPLRPARRLSNPCRVQQWFPFDVHIHTISVLFHLPHLSLLSLLQPAFSMLSYFKK
jgi:hypothetical protein